MFPKNIKSMRLLGMFYEAQNNTFKAQELYLEILEGTPEDNFTMKRLISLYRNNDLPNDAISMINKYLEINQIDEDAWMELCDIYLSRQNFQKAQYCYEELIVINPQNYQYNIKYAEILYSQQQSQPSIGTLELARKYFSHALILID
jgi:ER membrane protein complex subunit 2